MFTDLSISYSKKILKKKECSSHPRDELDLICDPEQQLSEVHQLEGQGRVLDAQAEQERWCQLWIRTVMVQRVQNPLENFVLLLKFIAE